MCDSILLSVGHERNELPGRKEREEQTFAPLFGGTCSRPTGKSSPSSKLSSLVKFKDNIHLLDVQGTGGGRDEPRR